MIKKFKTSTFDDMNYCTSVDSDNIIRRLESIKQGCVESFEFDEIKTLEDFAGLNKYMGSRTKELLSKYSLYIVNENEIVNDVMIARATSEEEVEGNYVLLVANQVTLNQLYVY